MMHIPSNARERLASTLHIKRQIQITSNYTPFKEGIGTSTGQKLKVKYVCDHFIINHNPRDAGRIQDSIY